MKFSEIEEYIARNSHLIGTIEHGAILEELVPVPVGYEDLFFKYYCITLDAKQALALFISEHGNAVLASEFSIYAIYDKKRIHSQNFLGHKLIKR